MQLRVLTGEQPSWITLWAYEGDKPAADVVYLQDRDHMDGDTENSTVYYTGIAGETELDGYYESSFYNPGTPAWQTADTTSAWGADHMIVHRLAAAENGMVVCSQFAEGGYGTFLLETNGDHAYHKRWSEKRGTNAAAADSRYVYIIPHYHLIDKVNSDHF